MADFDESADYAVFDDMVNGLKAGYFSYKDWMGGQFEFMVQDKYKGKRRLKWGKPSIFICNRDPRDTHYDEVDWAWMEENVVFYEVRESIFRASTE